MELLDQLLLDLPIMQKLGQHVQVDVRAVHAYEHEGFAAEGRERVDR